MREIWKDIEGYDGVYQINQLGVVRWIKPNGEIHIKKAYFNTSGNYMVRIQTEGKRKEYTLVGLMAKTFLGPAPEGYVPHHINRCKTDNFINNIEYISRKQLGEYYGKGANRRPVVKINNKGEMVEHYSSAGEAARKNHLSKTTVCDRCNGKRLTPCATDGFAYAWSDDGQSINRAIRKIKKECMPKKRD